MSPNVTWLVRDKEVAEIVLIQEKPGKCVGKLYIEDRMHKWTHEDHWVVPMDVGSRFVSQLWRNLIQEWISSQKQKKETEIMNQNQTQQNLALIVQAIAQNAGPDCTDYVDDKTIAEASGISIQDVRDYLDVLEQQGKIESANSFNRYCASLTASGRILLRDPHFAMPSNSSTVIHVTGNHSVIVNANSTLNSVTQTINSSPHIPAQNKDELKDLINQLNEALKELPDEHANDAEAVAETAKSLVENMNKEKPNPSMLKVSAAGLKQAAENLAQVAPTVFSIAKKLAALVVL